MNLKRDLCSTEVPATQWTLTDNCVNIDRKWKCCGTDIRHRRLLQEAAVRYCAQLAAQTDCPPLCTTCSTNRLPATVHNLQHKPTARYCAQLAAQTDCPLLCTTCSTNRLPAIVHNTHYSSFISLHR